MHTCEKPVKHKALRFISIVCLSAFFPHFCLGASQILSSNVVEAETPTPTVAHRSRATFSFPARIDRIEWKGNSKTHDYVLLRELPWKPGDVVTEEQFQVGLKNIGTLSFILVATGEVVKQNGENVAVIEVVEKFSINLIFSAQAAGRSYWLDLGVGERNFLGRSIEVSGLYENFQSVHGGRFWIRDPRIFGSRYDATFKGEGLVRPRPEAAVQRIKLRPEVYRLSTNREFFFGAAIEGFKDVFYQPLTPLSNTPPNVPTPTYGFLVEPLARFGQIFRSSLRLTGQTLEINPAAGFYCNDLSPNCAPFFQFNLTGRRYWDPGNRWNLLLRVKGGVSTDVPFQMQYYFGGVDFFRGYVDNYVSTRSYFLYNFDVRFTLFEWRLLAIQPFWFTDGVAHGEGQRYGSDTPAGIAFSTGIGLNCSIPTFVDSALRLEMSFPLKTLSGPVFGISTAVFY